MKTPFAGYVIFDKVAGAAEVDVVNEADEILDKINSGEISLPNGVSYTLQITTTG